MSLHSELNSFVLRTHRGHCTVKALLKFVIGALNVHCPAFVIYKLYMKCKSLYVYVGYGQCPLGMVFLVHHCIGAMLNTEGMLHIAFNGAVYKKSQSGLLTRGNAIRQKGKIFSTFGFG